MSNSKNETANKIEIFDPEKFKKIIKISTFKINNKEDLEEAVKSFENEITTVWKESTYSKKINKQQKIPLEIITKIQKKRKLRKQYQQTLSPQIKRELNSITQEIKNDVQNYYNKSWNKKLEKFNNLEGNPWKVLKY